MGKKIMFFMYSLHDGGAQRTIVNIINNIDKEKFEVLLVLGSNLNNIYLDFLNPNIRICNLNSTKLRYCVVKLAKMIRKENPSLLFTTLNDNNITLLVAKMLSFVKTSAIVREASNRSQSGRVTFLNRMATYLTYNFFASGVVALSKGVKDDLTTNFRIQEKKINVIYNPVEVQEIRCKSNELIDDIDFHEGEKTIIAIGRLVDAKDYTTLLKSFQNVSDKEKVRLLILGKGLLENKLRRLADELGISDKVNFLGYKSNPYKYLKKSEIFVLSSKWEGFGHVIVEAMACGVPVIATDCKSGPREIIENNRYGILVPVGDVEKLAEKIIEVLKDDKLRQKLTELGYERSHYFKASEITNQYARLFDEFIDKNEKKD
jgi:glycosyltransferase involved in cell wall biosynthesis